MQAGDENREPFRFAEDDDSDDLGGFSRGKRSYEDEEDEENGGWAINEDHSDRLWDSAEDVDEEEDEEGHTADADDVEEDDEEEADLFGGGAVRGRRGRPKGSTNANREKAALSGGSARDSGSAFGIPDASLFDDQDTGTAVVTPNVPTGAPSGSRVTDGAAATPTAISTSRRSAEKKPAVTPLARSRTRTSSARKRKATIGKSGTRKSVTSSRSSRAKSAGRKAASPKRSTKTPVKRGGSTRKATSAGRPKKSAGTHAKRSGRHPIQTRSSGRKSPPKRASTSRGGKSGGHGRRAARGASSRRGGRR